MHKFVQATDIKRASDIRLQILRDVLIISISMCPNRNCSSTPHNDDNKIPTHLIHRLLISVNSNSILWLCFLAVEVEWKNQGLQSPSLGGIR